MTDKKALLEELHNGVVTVVFDKVNGGRREMRCTLDETLMPARSETVDTADVKPGRKENPDVQRVYDVDVGGWRSFRWDKLILDNLHSLKYKEIKDIPDAYIELLQDASGLPITEIDIIYANQFLDVFLDTTNSDGG
jgi:hypothetical protein